jgi:hypothetical protein
MAMASLSEVRDFQSRMVPRWKSAIGVAHARNAGIAFGRLSREASTTAERETLGHKAKEFTEKAESLRSTHRVNFPKGTR